MEIFINNFKSIEWLQTEILSAVCCHTHIDGTDNVFKTNVMTDLNLLIQDIQSHIQCSMQISTSFSHKKKKIDYCFNMIIYFQSICASASLKYNSEAFFAAVKSELLWRMGILLTKTRPPSCV